MTNNNKQNKINMKKTLNIVRYALVSLFSFLFIGSSWAATQDEVGETPYSWVTFNELPAGAVAANTTAANQGSNTTGLTLPAGTAVQVATGNMAYQFGTTSTSPSNFVPNPSVKSTTYVTFLNLNGGSYNNSAIWGANGRAYSGLALCVSGSGTSYTVMFAKHVQGGIQGSFNYTVPADKITGFHCYAVTIDGNRKCHCYVDGVDVSGEQSFLSVSGDNNVFGWGQLGNAAASVANGLQVSDFRVYNKVLTAEQLKTIAGPERFYDARWGNMGAAPSTPGVTTGSIGNGGYTGFTFNLAANDNISPKEIGKKGTVKIKKLTLVSRNDANAAGMSKIRLTQGDKTIDGTVEIKTDNIRIYGNKYPGDSNHLWTQTKGYYVATFTSDVEFDVSQNIAFQLLNSEDQVTSYGLRMIQPANSVLKTSNDWSPAIEIVGDFTKADIKATATISEDVDWSDIEWDDDEPTEDSAIEITVENNAVITLDHTLTYPSLKISGACTLKYAAPSAEVLATLLPGRAEKVVAPIAETITGDMPIFACSDQVGCQVTADATGLTYTPSVPVKARTININFAGGRSNVQLDNASKLNNGEYATQFHGGFPMLGSKWNDLAAGGNTSGAQLTAYDCDGNAMTLGTAPQITVSNVANPYTTGNNHSVSDRLLFGYCDDGNDGPRAAISNIPFAKYRIYAYFSTDTTDKKLGYLKVTAGGQDTNYCGTTNNGTAGTTKQGTDAWGKSSSGGNAIDLGESINYLVTDVMTASSITLEGKKATDSRAGIAGYQIVDCSTEGHYLDVATTLVATVKSSDAMINWDDIDFGDELDEDTAVEITVDDDANQDVYILQGENPIVAKSIKFVRGAGSHGVGFMLNSQSTYDGGKITSEVPLALTTPVSIDVDAGANDLSYGYTGSGTISPTIATTGLITIAGPGVIAPTAMPYNNFTIAANGKLQVNVSSAMTINGIAGAGTFIKTGTAELTLNNKSANDYAIDGTTVKVDAGAIKLNNGNGGDPKVKDATFILVSNANNNRPIYQNGWCNLFGTITFENEENREFLNSTIRTMDGLNFVKRGAGMLTLIANRNGNGSTIDGVQGVTVEAGKFHFNNNVMSPSILALDFSAFDKTATPVDGDFTLAANTSYKLPSTLGENEAFTLCTGTLSGATSGKYVITVGEKTDDAELTFEGNTVKYAWLGSASATISEDTKLSDIIWEPAVTDPSMTKLMLTVANGAAIILDGTFDCASLAVTGDAKFVADDSVYEDGCWEKVLFNSPLTISGQVSFGELKEGFYGAFTQTANSISLRAQNKEVISINIAGGSGGGTAGADSPSENLVTGDGFYGIAPTLGGSWNNINKQWQGEAGSSKTIEIVGPNAYDGKDVIERPTMSLSATGKNTYQCGTISNPFLRGYLDDGGGVTVEVHGVPYTTYDIIVYATSDNASTPLAPITINGTQYTFKNGETTPGSDVWGVGQYATPEIGKNALRVNGCTGDTVTINAVRTGGRATLCAVQVINKGDVVIKQDFSATISGSTKFSDITWDEGKTFEEGQLNEVTITVADGEGEVEIEFDKPDMMLGKITITCARPIKFKATEALPNVGQFIVDGCTGGITYAWPVTELKTAANGVTYAGGAGTADAAAPITFAVNNGSMTLKDATFYIGTTHSGTQSMVNMENATVYANGDAGFGIGQASFNLSGTTMLTSEKVVLSQGAAGRTSNLTLSDSAEIVVTGSTIVDSNQSSIMFGHWDGPSTFTMGDNAKFTATDAQVLVGKTGNNQTININGGVFTAKGIKASASASGTNALNLNGGELKLGEYGITSYNAARTIPVTVAGDAKIASTAAMPITQVITVNTDKILTFDATDGDITISTAVVNNGTIKVVGGNVIFTPKTFNGTIIAEGTGKAIYGYTVEINDCGEFTVPSGVDPASVRLYRADGTVIENTTIKDGKILFDPEFYGKSALMEYLFKGTLASTGTDTGSLQFDGTHCFPGAEYVENEEGEKAGGIYAASAPWRDLTFPGEVTVVMYGKVMKTDNTCQIGIGSTTQGSRYTLFLASGDVAKEEVVLGYAYGNINSGDGVEKHDVLCRMTVPHAQTTDHLYAFTLKKVGEDTVVNIYLDGEVLQPYVFKNQTVTLGNGIQLGSIHGGIGRTQDWPAGFGFKRSTDVETDATLDFVRVYDVVLNDKVMRAIAKDYPYQSPSGSFNRTLTENGSWVETDAWTKVGDSEQKYSEPDAGSSVTITPPEEAGVTLTSNLAEVKTFEAMTFNAGGKITVVKGEESTGEIVVAGRTTISTDTQISFDAMELGGAVSVAANKTLTFDFSSLDLTKEFSNRSIRLTGTALLGDDAKIEATGITTTTGRTAEIGYDESTQQYSLAITVDQTIPFTYTDGVWTWGGLEVGADIVEANPDFAIVVAAGTLQATVAPPTARAITVNEGAVFDVNGQGSSNYAITLNGGELANTGDATFVPGLTLTANSSVNPTGDLSIQSHAGGWNPTTITLGENTLAKKGEGQLILVATTITGTGTLDIQSGKVYSSEATTFADGTIKIASGATYQQRAARTLTVAKIIGVEGALLQNNSDQVAGTISAFTLEGAITLVGTGNFYTITLDEAAIDIATQRGLMLDGEGSVKATITAAEMTAGKVTVFTKAEDADIDSVTLVDEDGNVLTNHVDYAGDYDEEGNYIANFSVTFTVPTIEGATPSIAGYTIGEDGSVTVPYGESVTLVYTADNGKLFNDGEGTLSVQLDNITDATTIATTIAAAIEGKSTAEAEAEIFGGKSYLTLAEAFAAATDNDSIVLLKNVALTDWIVVDKKVTLDLDAFSVTQSADWAPADSSHDHLFCVAYGGKLQVVATSSNGAIDATGGDLYGAIKMTKKGDVREGAEFAELEVLGGQIIGNTAAISGHGARPGTKITIDADNPSDVKPLIKAVVENDSVGIFNPQDGTVIINDGTIEGAMGIIMKSGDLFIAGGKIVANGEYAEWVKSNNGFNNTGDAIEIDNIGYPGEVATVFIDGTVIVESENGAAVASHADGDHAPITSFIAGGKFKGAIDTDTSLIKTSETGIGKWTTDADGYKVPAEDPAEAKIGTKLYLMLADAITAVQSGETIDLLEDVTIGGITIPSGKNFTMEFGLKTITFQCPGAGSAGTKTTGFQILEGSTIIFQNGTIQCSEENKEAIWQKDSAEKGIAMVIQNYADLTLKNMQIDGTNIAHNGVPTRYVMSNNSGTVAIEDSYITAAEGDFAFDTCKYGEYDIPSVTVGGVYGVFITGNVELSGGNLALNAGALNGELVAGANIEKGVVTKAATFEAAAPAGYIWDDNGKLVAKALPTATQDTTITVEGCDLAVKYTLGTAAVGYDDWNVDFEISSDIALGSDEFTLKGSNPLDGEPMVDFPLFALEADTPVKLLETFAPQFKITYAQLIELTGGTYTCAVVNKTEKQANVTVKIILSKEGEDDIVVEGSTFKGTLAKDYGIVISDDGKDLAITGKGSADVAPTFTTKQKRSVEEAVIRDGVKIVGKRFFKDFTKLNKVTVGKDVTTIGEKAFYKCMSLEKIVIENPDFDLTQLTDAVVYQLMLDESGVPYPYPSIQVAGYEEVLYGKYDLKDEWVKVEGWNRQQTMQETGFRFFQIRLQKVEAQD